MAASWLANLDEDWVSESLTGSSSPPSAPLPIHKLQTASNATNLQNYDPRSRIPRLKNTKGSPGSRCNQQGIDVKDDVMSRMADDADRKRTHEAGPGSPPLCSDRVPPSRTSTISTQSSIATQIHYHSVLLDETANEGSGLDVWHLDENYRPALTSLSGPGSNLKRKIAEAVTNGGQLKDLFSPMNLERMFQPLSTTKLLNNENLKASSARSLQLSSAAPSSCNRAAVDIAHASFLPTAAPMSDYLVKATSVDASETTLPLATSTIRAPLNPRLMSDLNPNASCDGIGLSMCRDANENFSPVSLGNGETTSRDGKFCEGGQLDSNAARKGDTHVGTAGSTLASRSPSPPGVIRSANRDENRVRVSTGSGSQLGSSSVELAAAKAQKPYTLVKKSVKRTSMGNTKLQSPRTVSQMDRHNLTPLAGVSVTDMPSSPSLERTPKRVRLSDMSGCVEPLNPRLRAAQEKEIVESEIGLRKRSYSRAEAKFANISFTDGGNHYLEDHSIKIPPGRDTPRIYEPENVSGKKHSQFLITGLTSIKTIPPSSVSNILPKQIGQMTFDEKQLTWIKVDRHRSNSGPDKEGISRWCPKAVAFSDDDALQDISDLSVGNIVARGGSYGDKQGTETSAAHRIHNHSGVEMPSKEIDVNLNPRQSSSVRSFYGSSSIGDPRIPRSDESIQTIQHRSHGLLEIESPNQRYGRANEEEIKRHGLITQDAGDFSPPKRDVSETAPVSSSNQTSAASCRRGDEHYQVYDYSSALGLEHEFSGVIRRISDFGTSATSTYTPQNCSDEGIMSSSSAPPRNCVPETPVQTLRTPSMRLRQRSSYDKRKDIAKPGVSSIYEEVEIESDSEISLHDLGIQNRSSIAAHYLFSSPFKPENLKQIRGELPPPSSSKTREVSFFNTPLPEISYHYLDFESAMQLEISYVAKLRGDTTRERAIHSFSAATNNLVKHLTDIEPYEPYWEYTKQLRLANKSLVTLHTLNEFCPRIEDLDVHGNDLGQVTGVPHTVRELNVSQNCLSSLTTWGHLINLQYLDLSGNGLDSLSGLKHLFHLRDLRVDENQITNITDIFNLGGLLSFSARRNCIAKVNFENSNLKRLALLDLKDNLIEEVSDIHHLAALSSFNLDNNKLRSFGSSHGQKIESLRTLKLNQNYLKSFDIALLPNIRVLYLDQNRIEKVDNLGFAKHLDSFSMRKQSVDTSFVPFEDLQEVRKLYIAGNQLHDFSIRQDFPNLQYLEVAYARLTSLPKEFGMMVSNVRVLNLNSNAISDLRPLYGILRLKKLSLAGNRLNSLKRVSYALKYFPMLRELDLRFNPLTVGFYAHVCVEEDENTGRNGSPDESVGSLDDAFKEKLDIRTAIQRRCYEIVVGENCPKLKTLDGLKFSASKTLNKDYIWEQMQHLGIVANSAVEAAVD